MEWNNTEEQKQLVMVLDGSVLRNYIHNKESDMDKIFERVNELPAGFVKLFTTKRIMDAIETDRDADEMKLQNIRDMVIVIDTELIKGNGDALSALAAINEQENIWNKEHKK